MEDKVYDLIEKMYLEFNSRFDKFEKVFDKLEKSQVKLEQEFAEKFGILNDAQKINSEKLEKLDDIEFKLDSLIEQVNAHEFQLKKVVK